MNDDAGDGGGLVNAAFLHQPRRQEQEPELAWRVEVFGEVMMKAELLGVMVALVATTAEAEPIYLRCENVTVASAPGKIRPYAMMTVDLDTKKINAAYFSEYENGFKVPFDITNVNDQSISAVSMFQIERRMTIDRLSGRMVEKLDHTESQKRFGPTSPPDADGRYWTTINFECKPSKPVL